jgi:iron-sulfur cluster assembly protein
MVGDITITGRAVERIRQLLAGRDQRSGLRVKIISGRCSDFAYETTIDAPMEEDEIFDKSGVRILVDPESFLHLNGWNSIINTS